MLIKHAANPNPPAVHSTAPFGGKSAFSKSTGAVSTRPSIKDTIAARKRAQAADTDIPQRPGSAAESSTSPVKATAPARPATAMSTSTRQVSSQSVGTLSSAPVRPRRRPDIARPITADGPGSRLPKAETPQGSPSTSPARPRPKTPGLNAGAMKFSTKKAHSPAASPAKSKTAKKPISIETSPTKAAEDFTMVIPSLNRGVTSSALDDIPSNTPLPLDPFSMNQGRLVTPSSLANDLRRKSIDEDMSQPMSQSALGFGRQSSTVDAHQPDKDVSQPLSSQALGGGRQSFTDDAQSTQRDMSQPMNLQAFGDGRQSPKKGIQRISMSPRNIVGRKENMQSRAMCMQDQRPLKVYEDPVNESPKIDQPMLATPQAPRALGELPVNEPKSQNRTAAEQELLTEKKHEGKPAHHHQDWTSFQQSEYRQLRKAENIDNPMLARKILESGIVRIQARSLDVHGFRKLQALIPSAPASIWEDGYKLQELLVPLLDYLEAPNKFNDVRDVMRDLDIKTQILVVVKLLMRNHAQFFEPFYPQTLSALVTARKYYHPSTHIVAGLEETASHVITNCGPPAACISSMLDLLDVDRTTEARIMALEVLQALLHKSHLDKNPLEDVDRMGRLVTTLLDSPKPEVRRATLEMALELRYNMEEGHFWTLLADTKHESKGLITYYLARNHGVHEM